MFLVKCAILTILEFNILTYPSLCVEEFFSFPVVHKQERPLQSFQQKAPAGRKTIRLTHIRDMCIGGSHP